MTQSTEVARGIPSKSLNKKNLHRLLNVLILAYLLDSNVSSKPRTCAAAKTQAAWLRTASLVILCTKSTSLCSPASNFQPVCCTAVQQSLTNVCQASCAFRTLDFFPTIRHQSLSALKCPVIDCFLSRVGILTRDIDM